MSLVLNVEILGEFKNLTKATQGSQSELTKLNKRISGFSKTAKAAFASIGVGLSFAFITRELTEATKAAVEDTKSQALLAKQLENTTGATKSQIAEVEKSIKKFQTQAAVADDVLRPAFASLVRSTGDVEKSTKLMSLALDISAGTGKSLEAVTMALGKSLNGSDTALIKLIPSIKGVKDPMAELERQFKGAADEAANTDPYARMNVIFGEIQETIGMAMLPVLQKFSTWLSTPEGEEKLGQLTDLIVGLTSKFAGMIDWVLENNQAILTWVGTVGGAIAAVKLVTGGIAAYRTVVGLATAANGLFATSNTAVATSATAASAASAGLVSTLRVLGTLAGVVGTVGTILTLSGDTAKPGTSAGTTKPPTISVPNSPLKPGTTSSKTTSAPQQTINNIINVKQVADAKAVTNNIASYQNKTGVSLGYLLK